MAKFPFGKKKSGEGSPKDMRADKAQAKKRGMGMKQWEGSAADKQQDAMPAFKRGGKVKKGKR